LSAAVGVAFDDPFVTGGHELVDGGLPLSPRRRRVFAYHPLGYIGPPMEIVATAFEKDPYLGDATGPRPGSHFVFLASAAPPAHKRRTRSSGRQHRAGDRPSALADSP
jgi:hypothetical protein